MTGSIIAELNEIFPCREDIFSILTTILSPKFPTPPTLVFHGLEATGKTSITKSILSKLEVPHAFVDSRECITARHLLEQASISSRHVAQELAEQDAAIGAQLRCETVNTLENHLEKCLKGLSKFVLIFDGIDRQREMPPTLIPGLARLGSLIENLTVVFIISVPSPRMLYRTGVPHIHFSTYSRNEIQRIVCRNAPRIFIEPLDNPDYSEEEAFEDDAWLWSRYIAVVWDSIAKGAARDLRSFTTICHKLWRPFVQPIIDGTFGTRDFSKLLISKKSIFQGEDFLTGNTMRHMGSTPADSALKKSTYHDLPYYTKWLLCAAYLASYNPSRQDKIYFMKNTERRKRKRGGAIGGRISKHRKIPRHLLNPSPFSLDRLLAILHSIIPHSLVQSSQISTQIATLTSLRLLIRTGASGADPLEPSSRFRVQCTWDYVSSLGRSIGLEMRDYLAG